MQIAAALIEGRDQLRWRGPSARFASLGMTEVTSAVREFRLDQFVDEIGNRRMIQAIDDLIQENR